MAAKYGIYNKNTFSWLKQYTGRAISRLTKMHLNLKYLFSLLFLVLNMSCSLDAFRVDFAGDCTKLWATVLRFSPVVTELGLPDRGRAATDPVRSNVLFKL
jgi:hypothetical protein